MKRIFTWIVLCACVAFAAPSLAADEPVQLTAPVGAPAAADSPPATAPVAAAVVPKLDTGSTAWMIVASVLVILMTIPGLALFYGGLVRAKNMLAVLMQVFVTFALVTILWGLYAYSLAFKEGPFNAIVGGLSHGFLSGITTNTLNGVIPEYVFVMFQLTFAAITPALIIGGFAERIKFSAVLWFMGLWLTFVYAPIAHMVWGGGWLATLGTKDFAGGTVVHVNAGIAALVGCLLMGKRIGYGREAMPPHSLAFTMIGASLLWVGWFGFNVGSELAIDGTVGLVLINTQFATAAAVLGWMFAEWLVKGKPSMLGAATGAVAGLVAITPACGFVGPMGAMVLGALSGMICLWACTGLKSMFGYDDSLDVFGVHAVGGAFGSIATGVFMSAGLGGVGYAEGVSMGEQVVRQIIGTLTALAWSGVGSLIIYKVIDATIGLRVTEDQEREGLDVSEHGEMAYHG
jgi:ammonium transporter, Amt family